MASFQAGGPGPGQRAAEQLHPLKGLATWITALLVAFAVATVTALATHGLNVTTATAFATIGLLPGASVIPVFLVWLYNASRNAEESGYPQRRSPGWAIGGWFVPVIFLWFPYQAVADIWRAGQPPARRIRTPWLVILWWISWVLSWVTGFHYTHTANSVAVVFSPFSTVVSKIVLTVAAILLIIIVRTVSRGALGRGNLSI